MGKYHVAEGDSDMKRQADQINHFSYRPEAGQNPFTGFTSFQHFRGEKLYSDIVVTPEARMTETERVECYPVSWDAEELGREQGYYPDSSVAYIRILWKEYEPEQGVYNDAFIEEILEDARKHHQTLIFRLMGHSTRWQDDVPEWLKKLIPCPERPDMKRVKDSPTDPLFMELFLKAITHLGEKFDDDPTFEAIDISLPGSWGEGHRLDLYPDNLFQQIMDAYLSVFKKTQLMTQLGRPELIQYAYEKAGVRVGWRGDGLGEPNHTQNIYPPRVELLPDAWKYAPVSFEAYWWLCEWQRKGWGIDEIIEKTLEWHISSFNAKSIPIPWEWKEKADQWVRKMGYHFTFKSFAFPASAVRGDEAEMVLEGENVGVAPIYHSLPLVLRLRCGEYVYSVNTGADITKWLPGEWKENFTVQLPADMPKGEYALEIGIESDPYPTLYFATDAPGEKGFYQLGKMIIE